MYKFLNTKKTDAFINDNIDLLPIALLSFHHPGSFLVSILPGHFVDIFFKSLSDLLWLYNLKVWAVL